ncbi:MAG: DMT family transporter [Candidatus Diapherotrites archaeon]|nr:DMT family transporter [Candidatus Diapherotrites archaeon]
MGFSIGVFYGVIALLGWGISDFIARKAIEKEKYYKVFFLSQIAGVSILLPYLALSSKTLMAPMGDLAAFAILGAVWAFGCLAFYKAIEVGKLSIVSPVGASWAMVSALIGLSIFSEEITAVRGVGILITLVGIALASTNIPELRKAKATRLLKGVDYALLAMFSWGIMFPFMNTFIPSLGPFLPIIYLKGFSIIYLLAIGLVAKKSFSLPSRNVIPLILLVGLFDTAAFIGLNFGLQTEFVSIVSPTAAAFPMVTILLARTFLKEKLELNQKVGVFAIICGLVLMAVI